MRGRPPTPSIPKEHVLRRLVYAVAGLLALSPLVMLASVSSPAGAAVTHPTAAAAHAVRPRNLDPNKCWKIDSGYGALWYNGSKIVSSHSHYTEWCPEDIATTDGWQVFQDQYTGNFMADHASGNYLTEYDATGASPTCAINVLSSAKSYCEWAEFFNSSAGTWQIQSANGGAYITAVSSGVPVELGGSGISNWTISCVAGC
jgi:hypothetical protein